MKTRCVILFFTAVQILYAMGSEKNEIIAEGLKKVLIETYGSMKDLTVMEKFVIDLGRSTFYSNVNIWRANYQDINKIDVTLNSQLVRLSDKIYKYSDEQTGDYFKKLLKSLIFLGYRNLDLYYQAIIKTGNTIDIYNITLEDVDTAVLNPEFALLKMKLYDEERTIKKEIRAVMVSKNIKNKIGIYVFVYDFLNKIREQIINKDIEKMNARMNMSSNNPVM